MIKPLSKAMLAGKWSEADSLFERNKDVLYSGKAWLEWDPESEELHLAF